MKRTPREFDILNSSGSPLKCKMYQNMIDIQFLNVTLLCIFSRLDILAAKAIAPQAKIPNRDNTSQDLLVKTCAKANRSMGKRLALRPERAK